MISNVIFTMAEISNIPCSSKSAVPESLVGKEEVIVIYEVSSVEHCSWGLDHPF